MPHRERIDPPELFPPAGVTSLALPGLLNEIEATALLE